jgi:PAS domain S-box-containing protein
MGPWAVLTIAAGSVSLAIGGIHLVVGRRRRDKQVHLWFALAAAMAAANAFFEPLGFGAATVAELNRAFKWSISFQALCWIALTWYVAYYAPTTRRWLAGLISLGYGVAVLVNVVAPYGVLFSDISALAVRELPWGESYSLPVGTSSPWVIVGYGSNLLFIGYVIDTTLALTRAGERRRAIRLGIATFLLLASIVHGSLVDLEILQQPYLMTMAFLFVVLIMGLDLADEAVRASALERDVAAGESRWSLLLERVNLLVVGLDTVGRVDYVNPFFCKTAGFDCHDAIGKPISDFVASTDRARAEEVLRGVLAGEEVPYTEVSLATKDGTERSVLWSQVVLRDKEGAPSGTLSIGADVTERRVAEADRDAAIEELEILKQRLEEENLYLREEIQSDRDFTNMIGDSDALRYVLHRLQQVAGTDATVLIQGETGVGKELVARAIHEVSLRASMPFVKVNCSVLPANLIESELFGHEAGAFTGATRQRQGRFELADGGTLLLDEITELPLEMQSKLLRVIQEGEFERVGSSNTIKVDIRFLAATNRNVTDEIESGRFRSDLFYRLNVYPITVPPLRDRRSDIPLLVNHFVQRFGRALGKTVAEVPAPVLRQLTEYDWPGNVRELQNVLERAVIVSSGDRLWLPEGLTNKRAEERHKPAQQGRLRSLQEVEREHIRAVLQRTEGRIAGPGGAAEILDLHPNTLRSRMQRLGIGGRVWEAVRT